MLCIIPATAAVSVDDWTSYTAPDERQWTSVAFGNGVIVATSNNGDGNDSIMVSNNGMTYEMVSSANDSRVLSEVIWDEENSQFVIVGDNTIMLSDDGVTWREITPPVDEVFTSVASGDGYIISVATLGTNRTIYSTDAGETWSVYSSIISMDSNQWESIVHGDDRFVAVSADGVIAEFLTSNDISFSLSAPSSFTYTDIEYANNTWVIVSSGGDYRTTWKHPENGIYGGWTRSSTSFAESWNSVEHDGEKFIALASGSDLMYSYDADTWYNMSIPYTGSWNGFEYCQSGDGEMLVAVSSSVSSDDIITSGNIAPLLVSPVNTTIFTKSYPPLLHDIQLTWSGPTSNGYKYQVAKDVNFNTLVADSSTTNTFATVSLQDGTYYWRVAGYSDDLSDYMDYSTPWTFTVNASSTITGPAIEGTVYTPAGSMLSGVRVTIYNDTYTDDYLTTANGYYLFNDGIGAGSYVVQASKDGYETNSLNIANVTTGETATKNIILEEDNAPNYILPHYTRFVVRSIFGGVYEDVTVNVYEGDSATALFTQTTGSDGAVGFELSETTQYRLTIYSETDNIDTTYTTTPTDDSYNIYVSLIGSSQAQQEADKVLYGMHTDGNELNVTWNDTSGLTTFVDVNVKNRDNTTVYSLNSTESNSYLTQEINTTVNSTYIVELSIESDGLSETFVRTHVISFDTGVKPAFDLGFSAEWQSMFLAALSIIFIAVLFGSANAHLGAILVAVSGLFHVFITGWIPQTILTVAMMFIALIVSVAFYMRKSESI